MSTFLPIRRWVVTAHALCLLAIVSVSPAVAQAQSAERIENSSWSVDAYPDLGVIEISTPQLGRVIEHLRLGLDDAAQSGNWVTGPQIASHPDAIGDPHQKSRPRLDHLYRARYAPDFLHRSPRNRHRRCSRVSEAICCSSARPGGTPVDWVGTKEVKEAYGAAEVRNPSFLPRENPEVMYLALGQIASPLFHSVFDQQTDTAVAFPRMPSSPK